jgi:YebC/PmpR family DNA-binding regulatory protein
MSGHSKWATTKRQKAVVDAKRGAIFTKLSNIITIAAREKGGDPGINFVLRMAMDKARGANMPKENIERAIKRGTGEIAGEQVVELIYEGIGPAKSQFIIKSLTDNKNRSAAEVRHILSKYGGALGAVLWNFELKGAIMIASEELPVTISNDEFELELIDAGAEDIIKEEMGITIYTKPENLQKVTQLLESKNIKTETAQIEYVAKEKQEVKEEDKEKIEKFIEELENSEDIADYYTNTIFS